MRRTLALIPALAASLLAGSATANGGGYLWGSSLRVIGVGAFDLDPSDAVTIEFTDGSVAGRSGCNRYTGPVNLKADRIEVGTVAGTRMACPDREMEIERSFLGALESVTGWRIAEDGALELTTEDAPLIRAVAP